MKYKNKYTIQSHIKKNSTHKKQKYVVRIANGRNKLLAISMLQLFRNVLKIVKTRQEFKKYIKINKITINGRSVSNINMYKRPIAAGEYIDYGQGLKLICFVDKKLTLVDAGSDITYGYRKFTMLKGGLYQINLHHNYNLIVKERPNMSRGETVTIRNGAIKKIKTSKYILLNGKMRGHLVSESEIKNYILKFKKIMFYGVSTNEKIS